MKDVIQLLTKGLGNRRTGATSINVESSRSHCVFTCVVESQSKSMADGSSSLRTSRINLVDLAGSERQKLTGAAGERLKEAGNINRSLSQLGNLINILAEVSQSGKQRHIPYRDSKLTFLLQESLGGNAKLAMICAISPSQSCRSETFSTLRFAQRAKAIKNKAVINEVSQDDVNALREQIRQLKDELLQMKSNGISAESNGSYSDGWNARQSLKLLRLSLNRHMALPVVETDSDEEMEIDEDNVEKGFVQACEFSTCSDKNEADVQNPPIQLEHLKEVKLYSDDEMVQDHALPHHLSASGKGYEPEKMATGKGDGCDIENAALVCEGYVCRDGADKMIKLANVNSLDDGAVEKTEEDILVVPDNNSLSEGSSLEEKASACLGNASGSDSAKTSLASSSHNSLSSPNSILSSSPSILACQISSVLQSPTLSISPRHEAYCRKSLRTSSSVSASQKHMLINTKSNSGVDLSLANTLNNVPSSPIVLASSNSKTPTEHLAASLNRGLQLIDNHQQSSALRRSSFRFSIRTIDPSPQLPTVKVDTGTQTLPQEADGLEDSQTFICCHCKSKTSIELEDVDDGMNLQLVPVDGSHSAKKSIKQIPKVVEKVLTGAIRREMALEDICAKQASEIAHLNRLVEQDRHERECNSIIEQTHEDKITRLESLMDGILSTEEFREEEFISLTNEHKLLKEKYENHPEVLRVNTELKRVQEELDEYRNFFDLGERDVLIEEVQDLRNQLQYYIEYSSSSPPNRSPLLKLTCASEVSSARIISELDQENANETLEQERHHWVEAESQWISLTEELRLENEEHRSLAEKRKRELDSERKCAEELKEALQTAMQGHARILEQYADLQEKHLALHARYRKINDGITDVKKAAAKAGVKGAESKFINSLASEISTLKVEREKERQYWRNENKGLQSQLRDTAEAVQAAGELLVRLKEAEEAADIAQKRALVAEQKIVKAYEEIDKLKTDYERKIATLNQFLADSRLPKEAFRPTFNDAPEAKYDDQESLTDHRWKEEFKPFLDGENGLSRDEPYSWYSGYDRCNV